MGKSKNKLAVRFFGVINVLFFEANVHQQLPVIVTFGDVCSSKHRPWLLFALVSTLVGKVKRMVSMDSILLYIQ